MTEREIIRQMYLSRDYNLTYCYGKYYSIINELLDTIIETELMSPIKSKDNAYCLSKTETIEDGILDELIITRSGYTTEEPKEVILSISNEAGQHTTYVWCVLRFFSYLKNKDQVAYKLLEDRLNSIVNEKA